MNVSKINAKDESQENGETKTNNHFIQRGCLLRSSMLRSWNHHYHSFCSFRQQREMPRIYTDEELRRVDLLKEIGKKRNRKGGNPTDISARKADKRLPTS